MVDIENLQVVSENLFTTTKKEAAVTIKDNAIVFNSACIQGLEGTVYIRILMDEAERKMYVIKCEENDPGALRWCNVKGEKRRPRKLSGLFADMLYEMMGWDIRYRYNILADEFCEGEHVGYCFNLNETKQINDYKIKRLIELMNRIEAGKRDTEEDSKNADEININDNTCSKPIRFGETLRMCIEKSQNKLRDSLGIKTTILTSS